jgi:hypothetical protein
LTIPGADHEPVQPQSAPLLGEHNRELRLSESEIVEEQGVIGTAPAMYGSVRPPAKT